MSDRVLAYLALSTAARAVCRAVRGAGCPQLLVPFAGWYGPRVSTAARAVCRAVRGAGRADRHGVERLSSFGLSSVACELGRAIGPRGDGIESTSRVDKLREAARGAI